MSVDEHGPADDRAVAAEFPLPQLMTDHDDGTRRRHAVFRRCEEPPERRPGAEHIEVIPGDEVRLRESALAARADGQRQHVPGGDPLERASSLREVLIEWV